MDRIPVQGALRLRVAVSLALAVALAACAATPADRVQPQEPTAARLPYPATESEIATTAGSIYMGNLDAQIAALQRDDATAGSATLAGKLYHRYRITGRLADGERAAELLDLAIGRTPGDAEALALRATVHQAFHRFAAAQADLDRAAAAGLDPARAASMNRDLDLSLGRYARLSSDLARAGEPSPEFDESAWRAHLLGLRGDVPGASLQYFRAQQAYADVSPVPLAWLYTQQGIALLEAGDVAHAREFFAAAHERLPDFYLATEHLAECEARLGRLDAARTLYQAVIAQTGNPEFDAALADVEQQRGNPLAANEARRRARAEFETLLSRHHDAYAQHAAEFLLVDGDSQRAHALALENFELRRDVGSAMLLVRTGIAVDDAKAACDGAAVVLDSGLDPPGWDALGSGVARCATAAR